MTLTFKLFFFVSWVCSSLLFSQNPAQNVTLLSIDTPAYRPMYHFKQPSAVFDLPEELKEISGLSLCSHANQLLAINDEFGILYFLDKETGKVQNKVDFWKEGDYEGVEMIGNEIFVVKSTGTLYQITNFGDTNQETTKHKFFLSKENDVEALCLDAKNNRLLLGCKGLAGSGAEFDLKKAIYAFNLTSQTMEETPAYIISMEAVHEYLGTCSIQEHLGKLWEFFDPKQHDFGFSPSALAIHPITGEIFITSSKGKLLIVLSTEGKILHIEKLDKAIHPQPEGLCFDLDGTLYISNEAKKEKGARIYRFDYQP